MPFNPPASNTQSGNGSNLYILSGGNINIPDPLIINDLVVTNQATITDLTVASGKITLSDTPGNQELEVIGSDLFFDGQLLAKANDLQNISDWALYPAADNIDVDNKNISKVNQVLFKSDTTNILTVDVTNNLTYNGSVITPSIWSGFPATQTVNMSNNSLNNTAGVNLTGTGTSAILTAGAGNVLNVNGVPVSTGGNVSTWSAFPATQTVDMSNNSLNNTAGVNLTGSGTSAILTAGAGNVLNVNGVPVSTGGNVSTWSQFPATQTVQLGQNGLTIDPTPSGYSTSQLDTNIVIGKTTYLVNPNVTIYPSIFTVGSTVSPPTAINLTSGGAISLVSGTGVNVTGVGGVSIAGLGGLNLTGGGGIVATGATITLGTGALDILGGSVNMGAGTINMASGLINALGTAVNIGGGLITATSGGVLVQSGTIVCGTSAINGGGIVCYGGKIQCAPSLAGGTGGLDMGNCPITNVSTINGSAYPPPSSGGVISERATNTTPINITAVTFGTAQTILTMTITTTFISDINANVSFYYQTNSNTNYNLIFYLTLDGVQIGATMADTLGGVSHFSNCAIIGSGLNQSVGLHTVLLKAYAGSAPAAGNLTVIASSGTLLANLI